VKQSTESLRSASYVGCQRDTARRIYCRAQFAAVRRAAAPLLPGARRPPLSVDVSCPHSSKPAGGVVLKKKWGTPETRLNS